MRRDDTGLHEMRWNVIWARGEGCAELAGLLAESHAARAASDLRTSCIDNKATMLVAARLPSFDGSSVAVPHDFPQDPSEIRSVVAAVSGGPHSQLAVVVAQRLADRLSVPAGAVACHRGVDGAENAMSLVERIATENRRMHARTLEMRSPGALGAALEPGAVLVLGAPGGSWFQREIFGPGARLRAGAATGAVVVRQAPPRVYQVMQPARAIGSHMRVRDAIELTTDQWVAIADHGLLTGVVSREVLLAAPPHVDVASMAVPPIFVAPDLATSAAAGVVAARGGGPLPVADPDGRIYGTVSLTDLRSGSPDPVS